MNRYRKNSSLPLVLRTVIGSRQTDACHGAMRCHIGPLHYPEVDSGDALQAFDLFLLADTSEGAAI